jgi:M6 family metalloprotease-like protein
MLYVLLHEFFHTFGCPDYYVIQAIERVGPWSLMSTNGNAPTVYEK